MQRVSAGAMFFLRRGLRVGDARLGGLAAVIIALVIILLMMAGGIGGLIGMSGRVPGTSDLEDISGAYIVISCGLLCGLVFVLTRSGRMAQTAFCVRRGWMYQVLMGGTWFLMLTRMYGVGWWKSMSDLLGRRTWCS